MANSSFSTLGLFRFTVPDSFRTLVSGRKAGLFHARRCSILRSMEHAVAGGI
jgi:hypothetical protein